MNLHDRNLLGVRHYKDNTPVQIAADNLFDYLSCDILNLEYPDAPILSRTIANYYITPKKIKKKASDYDYIVFPSWELLTKIDPKKIDSKIVVIVFDLYLYFERSKAFRGISTRKALENLKEVHKVLPTSEKSKIVLENTLFTKQNLEKIDIGVDTNTFFPEKKPLESIDPPEKYLLYVGSFDDRKNVEFLLDILSNLDKEFELVFGGTGYTDEDREDLEQEIAKRGLKSRTHFTGYLEIQDLRKLYSNSKVYVHPAKTGGFELTPLEAAACGTNVLVYEGVPSSEKLAKTCSFEDFDAKMIADRIKNGDITGSEICNVQQMGESFKKVLCSRDL